MKHGLSFVLMISLAALVYVTPALAQKKSKTAPAPQHEVLWDWWFVWTGGDTPSREIMYVDALSVETVVDHAQVLSGNFDPRKKPPVAYIQADGITIFEDSKNKPAFIKGRARVKCDTLQMMFETSYRQYWQAERYEKKPPTQWFDVTSDVKFSRIAQFLCEPKSRTAKNMMWRVDQTEDPLNTTWTKLWNDVPQPKFTSKKTLAQAQADFNKTAERAEAIIASGTKQANETQARILRDEKVTAMEQRALFSKMRSKASPLLHSWLGSEERALVASWGVPNSSHNASNARFLSYVYGFERQYKTQDENGNVVAESHEEFSCNMTFEVRDGVINDYRSDGNYCGTAASGMPRGPSLRK
jgi:hypothetical protein